MVSVTDSLTDYKIVSTTSSSLKTTLKHLFSNVIFYILSFLLFFFLFPYTNIHMSSYELIMMGCWLVGFVGDFVVSSVGFGVGDW